MWRALVFMSNLMIARILSEVSSEVFSEGTLIVSDVP